MKTASLLLIWLSLSFCLPAAASTFDAEPGAAVLHMKAKDDAGYIAALLLEAEADIDVTAVTARVKLRQRFRNSTDSWVDGVYLFPLPEDAAVDALVMRLDGRTIRGTIKEREEAQAVYEQARERGQRASLLESERPNLFTASLANIPPQGEVEIEIGYVQQVAWRDGRFSLRLPTTLTQRYIPAESVSDSDAQAEHDFLQSSTDAGWAEDRDEAIDDGSRIVSPRISAESDKGSNLLHVTAYLNPGLDLERVESSSHHIDWHQDGESYRVILTDGPVAMDRDFLLEWQPVSGTEPKAAIFTQEIDGEVYATLMMTPPRQTQGQSLPRELIFVVDSSGSMAGESMRQAHRALRFALNRLGAIDRFNIIDFDDEFRSLFETPVDATAGNLALAQDFVNDLVADGGTQMAPAILTALRQQQQSGYLRQIVFITDGSVGNEKELFGLINRELGVARLFTVGIGSAPNSYFMRKAAQFGRGSYTYVSNPDEVERQMSQLFYKLESPVLGDIRVSWPEGMSAEVFPNPLPDLYLGEPLLLHARIERAQGDIVLRGEMLQQPWIQTLTMRGVSGHSNIAKLWSRSKIEHLFDRQQAGEPEEVIRPQIVELALRHSLATRYTSFVAVEEVQIRPDGAERLETAVPNLIPAGSEFGFPATATNANQLLLTGALFLITGMVCWLIMLRRRV